MKKVLLIAIVLGAFLTLGAYIACIATPLFNKSVTGSGKIVSRTINTPEFNGIDASRGIKVVIADSATDKITIEADDNIIDLVVVKADDGELTIGIDKSIRSISNMDITVTVPYNGHIRSLDASSAAQISSTVLLSAPEFSIDASSAAKIKAAIKATKCTIDTSSAAEVEAAIAVTTCEIEASSASKIQISGSAGNCDIELSSASKLNAEKLAIVNCLVDVSSAAHATVNCSGNLQAEASSGASIDYSGDCKTMISKSSGGSVSRN